VSLDERHLAELTFSEVTRALRALSSCYVERRDRLARGGALDSAGKRAAFALFYAPLHFLTVREIARALNVAHRVTRILDLGCGTGAAGAAIALENAASRIEGLDRNGWAVGEANWTYRVLELHGRAVRGDLVGRARKATRGDLLLFAYSVNELTDDARTQLLPALDAALDRGAAVLIVEPIARRANRWWEEWRHPLLARGGREDEWRFRTPLPERQRTLARAAGLDPSELTARTFYACRAEAP
jgi:hypothetical protein